MKKLLSIILLFLIVTTCTNCNNFSSGKTACQEYSQSVYVEEEIASVYITATGSRYHKEDCRYLAYSKIKISLKDALESYYIPCSVCKP